MIVTLRGWQSAIKLTSEWKCWNAIASIACLPHARYLQILEKTGATVMNTSFQILWENYVFFFNTKTHPNDQKRRQKEYSFSLSQSKSRNEPTVCTLCTNVHLQIPLSVEGIWRLLNGNCVSRMCDCECNKGVLSFCCACGLWVSYPLRSSLSSAATLRSSASISSSSCRLKNSCTSLESVHL